MNQHKKPLGDVVCEAAIYLGLMIFLLSAVGVACVILGVKIVP